ncbi:MAG: polysaccharide biosynthesis C-terminal domain-containing protein [Fibrobacterales bacterium]|nr:polysaccharide biosynthesis C-terminal domain-containing protein [Fibrobacterales bacterium]
MPGARPISDLRGDKRFLVKGSLYTAFGAALQGVSPLLTVVVARVFGVEEFGVYVSTQLLVLTLARVAVLGLDKGLRWYVPRNAVEGRPRFHGLAACLRRTVAIGLAISGLVALASFFGLHRLVGGLETLSPVEITVYFLSLAPWSAIFLFGGACEGDRRPQYKIVVNDFLVYSLAPLISLGLCALGVRDLALSIGLLASNLAGVLFYAVLAPRLFPGWRGEDDRRLPRELLSFSLPLGFSEVVSAFLRRVDLWMVLAFLGPELAGVYAVMVTISNGLRTIRTSFSPLLLPVVAGMDSGRLKDDLGPVYSYCVMMVTTIQLAIGLFIVIFPAETMMIAGKDYAVEVSVLGILMLGNLVNGFFGLADAVINGLGRSRFMFRMNVVALVFALAANAALIPLFGLAGAAVATMSYQALQGVWMNVYLRKMGHWPYARSLWAQIAWIAALAALYVAVALRPEWTAYGENLAERVPLFAGLLAALGATLLAQRKSTPKPAAR